MDWLDLFAVQRTLKSLLQHHSSKASILRCSAFFTVQLSHPYMITGKTIGLTQFSSVQSLSRVRLFATPWTVARQASLSSTIFWSLFKLMAIQSVMLSNHLILCHLLLLLPSVFPSIRVFSNESVFPIRLPKYWSFSFSNSPSSEYLGLISFRIDCFDLLAVQRIILSEKESQLPKFTQCVSPFI